MDVEVLGVLAPTIASVDAIEEAMIQATGWVVIRQWFDRVERRLDDPLNRARWRWDLPLAGAVLSLALSAAQSKAPAMLEADRQVPGDPPEADAAKPSLPPRALLRIGTDDLRMQDNIMPIAFSPDGRLVAAVAAPGTNAPSRSASIFEVRTGRRVKQLFATGHDFFWALSLAFSPDGSKLLCGEPSGQVAVWGVSSGRLFFRQKLHADWVTAVAFSSDGRLFASASQDGIVRLRRVDRPEETVQDLIMPPSPLPRNASEPVAVAVAPAQHRPQEIGCLALSQDGTRLITGTENTGMIAVWRVSDGQLLRHFGPDAAERLHTVAVTPDGRQILAGGNQNVAQRRRWPKFGFGTSKPANAPGL